MTQQQHDAIGSEDTLAPKEIEVFFDGDCPLCVREIDMLRRWDKASRIVFTDIADDDFDASTVGIPWPDLMARIHGRLPDGTIIEGVEVFRKLYGAVGYRKMAEFSRLPGISHTLDGLYTLFAKNRLRLTGRCTDDVCEAPS